MARKNAMTVQALEALGAARLAALVLDEATANAAFKRRVAAALASLSGPGAVAKLIDRRLSGLERARAFIDWDKSRAFGEDLAALLASIVAELGPADPAMATDRLLRFLATHHAVFQRIDDSGGAVQGTYEDGILALGPLVARLPAAEAGTLPDRIMAALGEMDHGYLPRIADQVIPHLPPEALPGWEEDLALRCAERDAAEAGKRASGRWFGSMTDQWRKVRQSIARAEGRLDHLIALEREKPERLQDSLGIAALLLDAGRLDEALDWARRGGPRAHATLFGLDEDDAPDDSPAMRQALLEAAILKAMGRKAEACAVLWDHFARTLAADILRAHLGALPEFEDIGAEETAMAHALGHPDAKAALRFFLAWPRHDLAARIIVTHRDQWSGSDWHILPGIAETLEHGQPLAATILYRVLLDDILARARSKAYGHGATHLAALDRLGAGADAAPDRPADLETHATYRAGLLAQHGRKSGFWALVDGKVSRDDAGSHRGRRPDWQQS